MGLKQAGTFDELQFQSERDSPFKSSHQPRIELKKPTLNVDTNPIEAIGFGNLGKEYPLELMSFQRRGPLSDDIVIEILYCGVCHQGWMEKQ